ncbi:MAG TPA: metallophosphoesterase [Ruminiclostridium sp.]|nr:metallophosphoesterase [Ruminiclostridium sp.]
MKKKLLIGFLTAFLMFTVISSTIYLINATLPADSNNEKDGSKPFTLVWLSDPQYYASYYPEIYDCLGDWFAKMYKKNAFEYAIVSGDIVNNARCLNEWEVANRNFKKLDDAGVPYGILAGNHDVITKGLDYRRFKHYFGSSRYKNKPWFGASMDDNRNHYDLVSFGEHDFVILYLGFGTEARNESISWSNKVLSKYKKRTAILVLHEYLNNNAELGKRAKIVFDKIVIKNQNIQLVLCGHYHGALRRTETVKNPDGTTRNVIEILSDYQKAPLGGSGYLRLLKFCPRSETLKVVSYSPYEGKYNYFGPARDSFTENIKLID